MEKITKGGISIELGILYQLYSAIYYLLNSDISEINLEWRDEDITIIDESITRPSLTFLQCKYISVGTLHFSEFYNGIMTRFMKDYEISKDSTSRIYAFSIYTNKGLDDNLDRLREATEKARRGFSPDSLESLYGRAILSKIRDQCVDKINLYYFLQVLIFYPNMNEDQLIDKLKKYLIEVGSSDPNNDLDRILIYLFKRGTGIITKNQLKAELGLDYSLLRVPVVTKLPFDTSLSVENIDKIRRSASECVTTSIPLINSELNKLDAAITLAELTTDQLYNARPSFIKGTAERRHLERASEDAEEIAGNMRIVLKEMKQKLDTFSRQHGEIIFVRKNKGLE